jgi:hypothetical protein
VLLVDVINWFDAERDVWFLASWSLA